MVSFLITGLACTIILWMKLSYRYERSDTWRALVTLLVVASLAGAVVSWALAIPWPLGTDAPLYPVG